MKRFCITLIITGLSFVIGFSQLSLIIEGGVNHGKATLTQTSLYQNKNITGGYLSLTPQYSLTSGINLRSEFQFSIEGLGFENGYKHNLYYARVIPGIEVNVLGPISVLGGLNYGFLAFTGGCTGGSSFKIPDGIYNKHDLGILTGFNLTFSKFNLAVKYNYGLANISDTSITDGEGVIVEKALTKNRFLQIGLGYRIDFKR